MTTLQARMILEILGKPADHIKHSLNLLIERLGKEKEVKILEKSIKDPLPLEKAPDLFTTFAEVTLEFNSIESFLGIIFAYMPANIELISPEQLTFKNSDINFLTNKLAQRLHEYDSLAKRFLNERSFLIEKLQEYAPHLFKKQSQSPSVEQDQKEKKNTKKKTSKKVKKSKN